LARQGKLDSVARECIPYVIISTIALIIISLIPELSTYLPIRGGLYSLTGK
jgi:TRAP-type C4-dicarboxylate transport system permease large subunit